MYDINIVVWLTVTFQIKREEEKNKFDPNLESLDVLLNVDAFT